MPEIAFLPGRRAYQLTRAVAAQRVGPQLIHLVSGRQEERFQQFFLAFGKIRMVNFVQQDL